jgi:NADPH:quinone reductase-like Zn-dependent oxidoreductase
MGTTTSIEAPKTMRRMICTGSAPEIADAKLEIEEVPVPVPRNGEVLIKVAASPVNPSDYGEWMRGVEEGVEVRAQRCGKEGSGVVIGSGGGVWANRMVGAKVGFSNLTGGQGAYSEYVTAGFNSTFTLPASLPVESACSFFVNPFTAFGIVDTAKSLGAKGFIHTGAASQLGQMLVKLCSPAKVEGRENPYAMTLINVVRREVRHRIFCPRCMISSIA